jgi:HEAT repeat protein
VNAKQITPGQSSISGIVQIHLEEFQSLGEQYQHALESPDYRPADLAPLERRIAAHLDGILVAGEAALPLLEAGLAAEESPGAFAAAYVLLRMNSEAAQRVLDAFLQAKEGQLDGIRRAFCHSPLGLRENPLRQAIADAPSPIAAAAAEVLAHHRKLGRSVNRLRQFLQDENPAVRCSAWRVTAMLGTATN